MVSAPIVQETPRSAAAASLEKLDLTKPTSIKDKLSLAAAPADAKSAAAGAQDASDVDATERDGKPRFVGNLGIKTDRDEPLLRETQNRFVLFPIQYHEVS